MTRTGRSGPPDDLSQMLERAMGLHQRGQLSDAEKLYRNVLRAKPNHVEARHFFGILRFQQGRADEALALIAAVLAAKPDYPEALYNRGNILAELARYDEALASYDAALALQPGAAETHHNRGNTLFKLRRHEEALASYDSALALRPDHADTLYNRANLFKETKRFEESLDSYLKAQAITRNHPDKFGIIVPALATCDWARSDGLAEALRADLAAGRSSVIPFTLVGYCNDPALHLQCAKNFVADRIPVRPQPLWSGTRYRHERIRIAYLSADFRVHATAFLIAELFERHDRTRFEVLGVSFGADDGSEIRSRIVRSFDAFHDVRGRSDREIASLLRELEVDIAIDLMGFTLDCRPEIFAHRPAPIQVSYLGYPGTIGADFLDYILADETVVPLDQQSVYAEQIVHLPDCYQVNDSKRVIAEQTPTRQAAGLPDEGFVFCSFNNNYKLRRPVFDVWMRLLQSVPGSALWLLGGNAAAERNLRNEAAGGG